MLIDQQRLKMPFFHSHLFRISDLGPKSFNSFIVSQYARSTNVFKLPCLGIFFLIYKIKIVLTMAEDTKRHVQFSKIPVRNYVCEKSLESC